jgi:TP901 family phage tail tape measure protein
MSSVGKSLTQNLTLPIVAAGTAITLTGVKFDTTLRRIIALTDVTADQMGYVRDEILKLAPAVGKSPQELAEAFYFIASSGFSAAESIEILTQTAKAAAAGLGDTQVVSRVVGASLNAFGKSNLSAAQATDELIRAIKVGAAEAPDFAGALGDVVGSAGLVGASFADTAGAIAAMTIQGISADESATSLNQIFRSLVKTTPAADRAFASVGLTIDGLRAQLKEKGLLSLLQTLDKSFAGNEEAAAAAFREVRALRGVLALAGDDNIEASARILEEVANGTDGVASAFAETEGPGRKMDRAFAQIQVTLIKLSEDVLPVVVELLEDVAEIVGTATDWFRALPQPVRDVAVRIAALTAALGPFLWITGKVTQGLGGIVTALNIVAKSRVGTKIASALIDPIVTGFKGLGAKIAAPVGTALSKGIESLMGNSAVSASTSKLGAFLGSSLGKASAVAFAAVAWAMVIETHNRIKGELAAQNTQIDTDLAEILKTGSVEQIEQAKTGIEQGLEDLNGVWDAGIFTTDTRQRLEANLDAANAALAERASQFGPNVASGLEAGKPAIDQAAANATAGVEAQVVQVSAASRAAGMEIPQSIAKGIIDAQQAPAAALAGLKQLMKDALTPSKQIARDIGILTSNELAAGLKDKRPVVREEAERVRAVAEKDLAQLILDGGKVGKAAAAELATKLRDKNPQVRAAAKRVKAIVTSELDKIAPAAGDAGEAAGESFASRLRSAIKAGTATISSQVGFWLPPAPVTPKRASGGAVEAGSPYLVNENTPRSEVFVPSTSGHVLTNADAVRALTAAAGGASSQTVNVNVYNPSPEPASTSTRRELRKLALTGSPK